MKHIARGMIAVAAGVVFSVACGSSRPDDTPDAQSTPGLRSTLKPEHADQLDRAVTAVGGGAFSGSVLVSQGNEIITSRGFGLAHVASARPNTSLTVYDAGSLAKLFTAVAVLQLAEAGRLRLDQNLGDFFPEIPPDKRVITLDQVLSHTAGFEQFHGGDDFQHLSRPDALMEIFKQPLRCPPGARYEYSNSGYTVLAAIIEDVSGMSWTEYLYEKIFVPAGMKYSGFYGDRRWLESGVAHGYVDGKDRGSPYSWEGPYWVLVGNGGLVTNTDDLFHWVRALRAGVLLGEPWVGELMRPRVSAGEYLPNLYDGIRLLPAGEIKIGYFGWCWHGTDGVLVLEKGGAMEHGHTALLRYEPEADVLIVILSNQWIEDSDGRLLRVPAMDALQSVMAAR